MSEELFKIFIPAIIALLIIWLIYRIKRGIKRTITDEIYNNFPLIKSSIDGFQQKIEFFKTEIEVFENKLKDIEGRIK